MRETYPSEGEVHRAVMIENVQFIYELALAELELEAFGVKYEVTNSLREFILQHIPNIDVLVRRLAYFKQIDNQVTHYYRLVKFNRTRSVNQYLTHWIYPYKGKFHPQMIRALLNILKIKERETVLDPFIGSGTVALEAQLLGINCKGIDISPLCIIQSRVKAESLQVAEEISRIRSNAVESFFSSFRSSENPSRDYDNFLDSISDERVRNFYLMARLVAISDERRRSREINRSFLRNLDMMIASVEDHTKSAGELGLRLGKVDVKQGDARDLPIGDGQIQGIITSPPYSIALDYVSNDAHALETMKLDTDRIREEFIGVRGKDQEKIRLYNQDMVRSYEEMHRVLEKGRCCAIVIGNATYRGQEVKTIGFTIDQCERLGFKLVKNINKIIYGLYNVIQTDNTLIFRKEK